jgi:hypothetical protein
MFEVQELMFEGFSLLAFLSSDFGVQELMFEG